MKIFVPNGFDLSKRKYFCNDYKLCWLISSVYIINFWKWTGNIFSKWKTNLHLPHRLAQSLLGVTKPETGILNINNFYISENQSFFWYDPARFFFLSVMRSFLWGQWRLWWLFYKCCWIHHLQCKPALVSSNWSISSILEKRQGEVKSYLSTIQDQLLPTSSAGNDHLHSVRFGVFLLNAVDFATSSESETDRRVPVSNILTRVGGTVNVKITKLYHYQRTTIDHKCQNWNWKLSTLGISVNLSATFYRIIKDRFIWVLLIRGERDFPFLSIPGKESLWFPFPNYGN